MDTGLILALVGLGVAGLASLLGIWMERDPNRPPKWAISLSVLIGAATVVSLFQSVADARDAAATEEDLARMLQTLDKLAAEGGADNPALSNFLSKEMEAQSRANPDVIKKVTARVSAEGGDPNAMLARHLPASEIKGIPGAKAVPGGGNPQEAEKLKGEVAALRKQLAEAKAAGGESEAAKQAAEQAKKEKAEADKKVQELNQEVERLQKQNERLKGKTTTGGTRWDKG